MLRITINGAGDISFHYFKLLKFTKKRFYAELDKIAKTLAETGMEIVALPDRGIPFEIAKRYKKFNGKKVYGTVPILDKDFGIKHLQPYIKAKVKGRKVIDRIIDTGNWYKQDLTYCLFGDVVLMLGNSLGALGELVYGYYLYKLFLGEKPEVKAVKKRIHSNIRAGENVPFSVIVYKPFVKGKLDYEIEGYIKKFGGKVYYVNSAKKLKLILVELVSKARGKSKKKMH